MKGSKITKNDTFSICSKNFTVANFVNVLRQGRGVRRGGSVSVRKTGNVAATYRNRTEEKKHKLYIFLVNI